MVYAKKIKDGRVEALMSYNYEPEIGADSGIEIISEEEYLALCAEIRPEDPSADPEQISDSAALKIITGEVQS